MTLAPRGKDHSLPLPSRLISSTLEPPSSWGGPTAPVRLPGSPRLHDLSVIPIMRGRLLLVAERYGTPRVLLTSAIGELVIRARDWGRSLTLGRESRSR
jgi:hypothetical protein